MDVVGLICMCAHSQLAAATACCTPDWENQGLKALGKTLLLCRIHACFLIGQSLHMIREYKRQTLNSH